MARGWRGIFVSTLLVVSAGCSAAQPQPQPQQQAVLPSATADAVFSIIARAVQQELRPVVRKLESQVESLDKTVRRHESRMESLDNRLTLLGSRMSTLTAHVLTNRLGEQIEELSSQMTGITARLDSQQSQLDNQQSQLDSQLSQLSELNTQLNEQKSQQEETAATVNNVTAQLDTVVTQQEDQLTETSQLVIRLDSQQSQLSELNAKLKQQKAQQEEIEATVNDNVDRLEYNVTLLENQLTKVSGLARRLDSQQSQLDELRDQLNEQKSLQNVTAVTTDDHLLTAPLDATTSQTLGSQLAETMNKTAASQESIDHLASEVKQPPTPRDCSDIPASSPSGVYLLRPSRDSQQPPVDAYCDMDTAGGNWTVFQRRDDIEPRQDFFLGWTDYKEGFGNLTKEFWWGLQHLFQLTSSGRQYELRIDLEAFDGSRRYATYQQFCISSEEDGYRLSASDYSGTAGDSLKLNLNRKFSTHDREQDDWFGHCAQFHHGAWWYGRCGRSNLNGRYRYDGNYRDQTGIWWWELRKTKPLKKVEMKIRPT